MQYATNTRGVQKLVSTYVFRIKQQEVLGQLIRNRILSLMVDGRHNLHMVLVSCSALLHSDHTINQSILSRHLGLCCGDTYPNELCQ